MIAETESQRSYSFLRPLCEAWLEKIEQAKKAKSAFTEVAEQCDAFFSRASGFMWKPKFKSKFLGNINSPKFQITVNKAFELVALFGPSLYWQYPYRAVRSQKPLEIPPELLSDERIMAEFTGGVQADPQQVYEFISQESQREHAMQLVRNDLMERYLNYSQREMPGGGLAMHSELAITEALVKGRGCLWAETYEYPGSGKKLTGTFYDSVDNLYVDPDCDDPTLLDAKWIARRHVTPVWELAEKFDLPQDDVRAAASFESGESQATRRTATDKVHRANGQTFDLVVWYEIWSKGGIGSRINTQNEDIARVNRDLADAFDEVVGDHAYICVAPNIPYPLNAPSKKVASSYDDDVSSLFMWRAANYGDPFPCYLDDRWPVACLDFYKKYGSAWPIAPLAPALGELICLNVLTSALVEQGYENRKVLIGCLKGAADSVKEAVRGNENPAIVEINEQVATRIDQMVQFLNRPEMNADLITAIQYVTELFDKRSGLSELHYAMATTQSRSAKDAAVKEEKASVRPDKMSKDVAHWQEEAADLEKFLARWSLEGEDLTPLLGRFGARLWRMLITDEDPLLVVREMKATVAANDTRKPNKEREAQNLQNLMSYTLPMLQGYAEATGDTQPLNEFFGSVGESIEQDVSGWQLGDWVPQPPPPEVQQQQEMMAQLEMQKIQADIQKAQIDAESKRIEAQKDIIEAQIQAETGGFEIKKKQLEFQFDRMESEQRLQQERDKAQQNMFLEALKHRQSMRHDEESHRQELTQDQQEHAQDVLQRREEARQKIQNMRSEGKVKVQQAKQIAKAKPKASNSASSGSNRKR